MKSLMAAIGAFCLMFASPALAATIRVDAPHLDAEPLRLPAGLKFASPAAADLGTIGAPARITALANGADSPAASLDVGHAVQPFQRAVTPTSRLPEPGVWAAMLTGFGIAGAQLRRGRVYRLVERHVDGTTHSEDFPAPDDDSALERALSVADGGVIEVWRGAELVSRLEPARHINA